MIAILAIYGPLGLLCSSYCPFERLDDVLIERDASCFGDHLRPSLETWVEADRLRGPFRLELPRPRHSKTLSVFAIKNKRFLIANTQKFLIALSEVGDALFHERRTVYSARRD
jgi:hypothetical protein